MTITYQDIFDKCQDISSYEGSRIYDTNGDSMYTQVHITNQDKDLIKTYTKKATMLVVSTFENVIESTSYNSNGVDVSFISDESLNISRGVPQQIEETIASYVMRLWLEDKDETRCKSYDIIYANMIMAIKKSFTRKRPRL